MAETPMGKDAFILLEIDKYGDTASLILNDGNGDEKEVAWKAPDATFDSFRWLASSVAAFHKIPVKEVDENG